jgi:hypothetical protein
MDTKPLYEIVIEEIELNKEIGELLKKINPELYDILKNQISK